MKPTFIKAIDGHYINLGLVVRFDIGFGSNEHQIVAIAPTGMNDDVDYSVIASGYSTRQDAQEGLDKIMLFIAGGAYRFDSDAIAIIYIQEVA